MRWPTTGPQVGRPHCRASADRLTTRGPSDVGRASRPAGVKDQGTEVTDPLTRDEPAGADGDVPVELDAVSAHGLAHQELIPEDRGELRADLDLAEDDRPVGWEPDDEESDFGPDFGPGEGPGHGPKLAPGPKYGPGHHPPPPHEHGPGPHKAPAKKAPGKKAPGKKAPGKKAPGPKKHPGHHPGPPHGHGPGHPPPAPHEHGPGGLGAEPDFKFGPGTGYGPGPGFGFGFGFGPGSARGRRRGAGPSRRGRPGDVRAAILTLLVERAMHGYEMMQEIAERSQDLWRPSPGSVYPTLQLLDDEGLIVGSEKEGSRKLFELTDEGRTAAEKIKTPPWEQVSKGTDAGQIDLRAALSQLFGAVAQAAHVANAKQQQRVVDIVNQARRKIYSILSEAE